MEIKLYSFNRKYLYILLSILICLLVFSYYSYNIIKATPTSDWSLLVPPDENNRVHHPSGFSIISPSGWINSIAVAKKMGENDGISLKGMKSQRHASIIKVFECGLENYKHAIENNPTITAVTFQGLPTFEKKSIEKRSNGIEDPSTVTGEMYFLRDKQCYVILYYFPFIDAVPENLSLYLDSFCCP